MAPIPGAPGKLSTESPASDWTSTTWSGLTPNFAKTSSGPILRSFMASSISTPSIADDLHEILIGRYDCHLGTCGTRPDGEGRDDVVGLVTLLLQADDVERPGVFTGQRHLRDQFFRQRGPVHPVFGKMPDLNVRPLWSKTIARCVGASAACQCSRYLNGIPQNPLTAPAGSLSDIRINGGNAWKARKLKPDPSMSCR